MHHDSLALGLGKTFQQISPSCTCSITLASPAHISPSSPNRLSKIDRASSTNGLQTSTLSSLPTHRRNAHMLSRTDSPRKTSKSASWATRSASLRSPLLSSSVSSYIITNNVHCIKNFNSPFVRAFVSRGRLLVTCTPLQNSLKGLFALVELYVPGNFHGLHGFGQSSTQE